MKDMSQGPAMKPGWHDHPGAQGGCQCGAVRYRIAAGPARQVLCGCRTCQRATGGAISAWHQVPEGQVTWHGTPATFTSSDMAERGFCPDCGTPLFFHHNTSKVLEFLFGTLVAGTAFMPEFRVGTSDLPDWSMVPAALPLRDLLTPAPRILYQASEAALAGPFPSAREETDP